jgi:tetratricopeptide (TPR) repeat protein
MQKRLSRAFLASALLVSAAVAVSTAWAKPPDLPMTIKEICKPTTDDAGTPWAEWEHVGVDFSTTPAKAKGLPCTSTKESTQGDADSPSWLESLLTQASDATTLVMGGLGNWASTISDAWDGIKETATDAAFSVLSRLAGWAIMSELNNPDNWEESYEENDDAELPPPSPRIMPGSITCMPALSCIACSPRSSDAVQDDYRTHSARRFLEIGRACEAKGDFAMAQNCYDEAIHMCPGCEYAQEARAALLAMEKPGSRTEGEGAAEAQEMPESAVPPAMTPASKARTKAARLLYLQGEKYRLRGDASNAHRCYSDACEADPDSPVGKKAKQRMWELEEIEP